MNGKLPIYEAEDDILKNLKDKNRLIIQSPTGSGKSTQVPQILWALLVIMVLDCLTGVIKAIYTKTMSIEMVQF